MHPVLVYYHQFYFKKVTLTYPLDTIRARLAFQVTGEHKYSGIVHTAISVMKNVSIFCFNVH